LGSSCFSCRRRISPPRSVEPQWCGWSSGAVERCRLVPRGTTETAAVRPSGSNERHRAADGRSRIKTIGELLAAVDADTLTEAFGTLAA